MKPKNYAPEKISKKQEFSFVVQGGRKVAWGYLIFNDVKMKDTDLHTFS